MVSGVCYWCREPQGFRRPPCAFESTTRQSFSCVQAVQENRLIKWAGVEGGQVRAPGWKPGDLLPPPLLPNQ